MLRGILGGTLHLINAQYRVTERHEGHVITQPNEETRGPPTTPAILTKTAGATRVVKLEHWKSVNCKSKTMLSKF